MVTSLSCSFYAITPQSYSVRRLKSQMNLEQHGLEHIWCRRKADQDAGSNPAIHGMPNNVQISPSL